MKNTFTYACLIAFFVLVLSGNVHAQVTPPPPDTAKIPAMNYNTGFDVIIKKNGEIIYGLVKEVGLLLVKYQRTDIPDGPVYTIPRDDIYAISYRNQVKDILNPINGTGLNPNNNYHTIPDNYNNDYNHNDRNSRGYNRNRRPYDRLRQGSMFRDGNVRIGVGFIRSYTDVDHASQYSTSASFPIITIGYDAYYNNQVRLGAQIAFGPHKFTKQEYSTYDSTQTDVTLKENIFTLHLYAKYPIADISNFKPYLIGGIGIHTSNIRSEQDISFITNPDKVVVVKSGTRALGIGILARIGTDYFINNKISVFGDVGIGPSILNFGISASVD